MKQTQKDIILAELKKGGWFSLGDALNLLPKPIYALSQRIGDLKKMGYNIEARKVDGHPYDEYRLIQKPKTYLHTQGPCLQCNGTCTVLDKQTSQSLFA